MTKGVSAAEMSEGGAASNVSLLQNASLLYQSYWAVADMVNSRERTNNTDLSIAGANFDI